VIGLTITWSLRYQLSAPYDMFCAIADEILAMVALSAAMLKPVFMMMPSVANYV
jgi:hypothetical protein